MTFFCPLSSLISSEADEKLIRTCSPPAVCWISHTHIFFLFFFFVSAVNLFCPPPFKKKTSLCTFSHINTLRQQMDADTPLRMFGVNVCAKQKKRKMLAPHFSFSFFFLFACCCQHRTNPLVLSFRTHTRAHTTLLLFAVSLHAARHIPANLKSCRTFRIPVCLV